MKRIFLLLLLSISLTLYTQTISFETDIRFCDNTRLNSVCETAEGDFIAVGSRSNEYKWGKSTSDLIIIKISKFGEFLTSPVTFGDTSMSYYGVKIIKTFDNNYVILVSLKQWGNCKESISILKIDSELKPLWSKVLSDYDFTPWSISEIGNKLMIEGTPKDDCIPNFQNCYILTDSVGLEISNNINSSVSRNDLTLLGTFEIGSTARIEFKCDYIKNILIIESIIPNRDTLWKHTFSDASLFSSIAQTDSNGFIILTRDCRLSSQNGIRFININSFGKIVIDSTYYNDFNNPIPAKIIRTSDTNYVFFTSILTKTSNTSNVKVVKITQFGEILWESMVGKDYIDDVGTELVALNDGYMLLSDVVGETPYGSHYPVFYRFDNEGVISPSFIRYYNFNLDNCDITPNVQKKEEKVVIYPNPAENAIYISIPWSNVSKYDIIELEGKSILNGSVTNNQTIDISSLKSGIYFIRINNNQNHQILKFIKQ